MFKFIIEKSNLSGIIPISGSKNGSFPILISSLLTDEQVSISNIPYLQDTVSLIDLLGSCGIDYTFHAPQNQREGISLTSRYNDSRRHLIAEYEYVSKMRASFTVLGPMLTRFGEAKVSLPGGCTIGTRPVDIHIDALSKMGADIDVIDGYIVAKKKYKKLIGADINLKKPSVGAMHNIMMAASLAEGITKISNAAMDPEVFYLGEMLNRMGGKVSGHGTENVSIEGVESLHGCHFEIPSDRMQAITYAIMSTMHDCKVSLKYAKKSDFSDVSDVFDKIGIQIDEDGDLIKISQKYPEFKPTSITTGAYPEYPTDAQAQIMTKLCLVNGESDIHETLFENRMMHVPELKRMGADIDVDMNHAKIRGIKSFHAAEVMATDLRASASLVMAALTADHGATTIRRIYHILRGYDGIYQKLLNCGAKIQMVQE
jgi:UDP-N-acetylglucosamine 1-carboxyvinyltransferase